MPRGLSRSVFALCALAYLLPLTALLGFSFLMLPTKVPNGWPDQTGQQLATTLYFLAYFGCMASTAVAWHLALGWIFRGQPWLAAQSRWLKLAALFAPACILMAAAQNYRVLLDLQATPAGAEMPEQYWEQSFRMAAMVIGWSLLFVPPALMAGWPRREPRS